MKKKEHNYGFTPPQFLVLTFLTLILLGTLLLSLPIATTKSISWVDALFTATSAMTVTGLIVVDTGSAFTLFGQVIIMSLIQIGGLGIMTFAVFIFMLLGRKIGFKERLLISQALNQNTIGGVISLAKQLFIFSIIIETIAFVLLSLRWVPSLGWNKGIYASLFHSISAFNNAGFSIWSDSLSDYVNDPIVNIIITLLFVIGGLGFTVIFDMWENKRFSKFSLHSKLMIVGTFVINILSILIVFSLEYDNPKSIGGFAWFDKLQASYFQALTPRTAGFNTLDISTLNESTLFFMLLLMFIGAGSASTGGGIKLTTFLTLFFSVFSFIKKKEEVAVFNRTITDSILVRALAITIMGFSFIFIGILLLEISHNAPFLSIVFEAVSAFGTVGLSMGMTGNLTMLGKIVIMFMMFVGKLGPLTLAFSFAQPAKVHTRYPREEILTG